MNRSLAGIFLTALLLPVWSSNAGQTEIPTTPVGTLSCKIVPHSGINLLIHSTKEVRCKFTPSDDGPIEHYKGETGIKFGITVNINQRTSITYSVLARHFRPGSHQLAGKYSGVGGGASFGLSVGDTSPIQNSDKSISLQPASTNNSGAGAAAGFTYLYLQADRQ